MSSTDRDRRALELFQAVIELPALAREEWLDEHTDGDAELRANVESLVSNHERTSGILDAPLDLPVTGPLEADAIKAALGDGLSHRYEIGEELGRGGTAIVFRAQESKHDRSVVIKALRPDVTWVAGPERFEREVQLAAQLSHPHILGLIDSGSVNGILFYVMPHLVGETLGHRMKRPGRIPLEEAIPLLRDTASALSYAHALGVVHRDLKPANILVVGSHPYLMDFGIAKLLDSETEQLTGVGHALGTPRYMPPEQFLGTAHVDHRTDIYAWGLIAYELLTGESWVRGAAPSPDRVVERLEAVEPALPKGLIELIARSVEPRADHRLSDIDQVLLYFESGDFSLSTDSWKQLQRRTMRASPWAWIGAVALVAVAAGAAAFLALRSDGPAADAPGAIAVAPFVNETGDPSLDPLGNLAGDWIAQGLMQVGARPVLPWPTVLEVARNAEADGAPADLVRHLSDETGATTVVAGAFYAVGDEIQFSATVADAVTGEVLAALPPVSAPNDVPQTAIRELRDRIMGALALASDERVASVLSSPDPPTFDAYRTFDRGQRFYLEQDYAAAADEFADAFREDSTFVAALVYEATMRFNTGQLAEVDSIVRFLDARRDRLGDYQENRIDFLGSLLEGDGERALRLGRRGLELGPGSRSAYNYAAQAVNLNRPAEALQALERIDPDLGEMRGWAQYWTQVSHATHLLGLFDREYEAASEMRNRYPERRVATVLQARALGARGDEATLETLLGGISALPPRTYWSYGAALVVAGEELAAHGDPSTSTAYLERAIDWLDAQLEADPGDRPHRYWLGSAYYDLGRFAEARDVFESLAEEFPDRVDYRGLAALAIGQVGDRDAAIAVLGDPPRYDPGDYLSYRARLESVIGDGERAIDLFSEALDRRVTGLPWLHASARQDLWTLAEEPRFVRLMERANEVP
jgi:tetratricopeptide (TPR) repeat protein